MDAQYLRDMARVPAGDRPLTSRWLIESRGEMSARRFLDEMRAATDWAPNLANYAQWESGAVTPKDANLGRVIAFHVSRGVRAPDFTPPAPAVSPEDRMLAAVLAQAAAIQALADELHAYRTEDRARIDQLEAWMDRMIATVPGAADMPVAGARPVPPASVGSQPPARGKRAVQPPQPRP